MPAIATGPREIDRKLHVIVRAAEARGAASSTDLARTLHKRNLVEFSYVRGGEIRRATIATIERYVSFGHVVGLLDDRYRPVGSEKQVHELEAFQDWLSDLVLEFLAATGCEPLQIRRAAEALVQENPRRLPTIRNTHGKLSNPPALREFEFAVKIIARLRSQVMKITMQPTFLFKGVLHL